MSTLDLSTAERVLVANKDVQSVMIGGTKIWDRPTLYTPWVERRRNRVVNPEFGNGTLTNWGSYFSPIRTVMPSDGPTAGSMVQIQYSSGSAPGIRGTIGYATGAEPLNTPFRIIARVKAPVGRRYRVAFNRDNGSGGPGATVYTGTGAWQEAIIDAVTGATPGNFVANVLIVSIQGDPMVAGDVLFYVDSAHLEFETAGGYFSGLTPDSELVLNEWSAAANASASVQSTREIQP